MDLARHILREQSGALYMDISVAAPHPVWQAHRLVVALQVPWPEQLFSTPHAPDAEAMEKSRQVHTPAKVILCIFIVLILGQRDEQDVNSGIAYLLAVSCTVVELLSQSIKFQLAYVLCSICHAHSSLNLIIS